MDSEPVIKSYMPLDDEPEKPKQAEKKPKDQTESFSPEEERAFAVGLTTLIVIGIAAVIILVLYFIKASGDESSEESQASQNSQEQVMGEKIVEDEGINQEMVPEQEVMPEETANESDTIKFGASETYTVEVGDTLYTIGQKLAVDWEQIAELNNLERPYNLRVGQELAVPIE